MRRDAAPAGLNVLLITLYSHVMIDVRRGTKESDTTHQKNLAESDSRYGHGFGQHRPRNTELAPH